MEADRTPGPDRRIASDGGSIEWDIHPGRLTWNLRIDPWKRKIIFQTIIFRFYVYLSGCNGNVFCTPKDNKQLFNPAKKQMFEKLCLISFPKGMSKSQVFWGCILDWRLVKKERAFTKKQSGSDALILGPPKNGLKASNFWRDFPMKSCSVCDFFNIKQHTRNIMTVVFSKPNHLDESPWPNSSASY